MSSNSETMHPDRLVSAADAILALIFRKALTESGTVDQAQATVVVESLANTGFGPYSAWEARQAIGFLLRLGILNRSQSFGN